MTIGRKKYKKFSERNAVGGVRRNGELSFIIPVFPRNFPWIHIFHIYIIYSDSKISWKNINISNTLHNYTENSIFSMRFSFFAPNHNRYERRAIIEFVNEIFAPFVTKKLLSLFRSAKTTTFTNWPTRGKLDAFLVSIFGSVMNFPEKTILFAYE